MRPTKEAVRLMFDGARVLADVESAGIRIDVDRLKANLAGAEEQIRVGEQELKKDPVWSDWRRKYGDTAKLSSRDQLAQIVFGDMKYPCHERTDTGRPMADASNLLKTGLPFCKQYVELEHLKKASGTFLKGILTALDPDGFLHPNFHLHKAVTYRSCVAKGTLIEVVRDVSKSPKGVPIENVKEGDFVYCFNGDRKLAIRKVLWAGKTGHRKVVRLHWRAVGKASKTGHLDVTPEHKIRMINGEYVEARHLRVGDDYRSLSEGAKTPKTRCLAMGRWDDKIYATLTGVRHDHRFVYEQLVGELPDDEVVHHKDGNHLNNVPDNLQRMRKSDHSKLHAPDCLTDEARRAAVRARVRNHAIYGDRFPKGEEAWNFIKLTKYQALKILALASGKSARVPFDFNTFKAKAESLGINLRAVKARYGGDGEYVSLGRLRRLLPLGRKVMAAELRTNFYRVNELLAQRGMDFQSRRWANQFGPFVPNNHKIVRIEYLDEKVDVYDLEVEEHHNFIANEICVHNSSSGPNFQNFPNRNPAVAKMIRECFIPRKKRRMVELDFSRAEVKVGCDYHKDPALIRYETDPSTDMHKDRARELFLLDGEDVGKVLRFHAKNRFVFAQFYGSVYFQCAPALWEVVNETDRDGYVHKLKDGTPLIEHLRRKGITELGECDPKKPPRKGTFEARVKQVEEWMWNRDFVVYTQWKKRWWEQYQQQGWFRTLTGFVCQWGTEGLMSRNDALNYAIQGSSFHCLLWCLIQAHKWLRKNRMKTLIVGQIHDSVLLDVPENELQDVLNKVVTLMSEDLTRAWSWIIVPMGVEAEVTDVDGNWYQKRQWSPNARGVWSPAA